MINYQHQISSRMFHFLNPLTFKASPLTSKIHRHMGLMLSRGAVESLPEILWRIVMKLPEFNPFSDKSARILLIFRSICLNFHVFQNFGGSPPPPPAPLSCTPMVKSSGVIRDFLASKRIVSQNKSHRYSLLAFLSSFKYTPCLRPKNIKCLKICKQTPHHRTM